MRKVIFIDGFLWSEVEKLSTELTLSLEGFEKQILPSSFVDIVKLLSGLRGTETNYVFEGSPYGSYVDTLFGRKKLIDSNQLLMFENSMPVFYFFVDANEDYVTQLYKTMNKKLTKNDYAKMELYRLLFLKSNMPLKLTYSLHEPNAKIKFMQEFNELYIDYLIKTTDYSIIKDN